MVSVPRGETSVSRSVRQKVYSPISSFQRSGLGRMNSSIRLDAVGVVDDLQDHATGPQVILRSVEGRVLADDDSRDAVQRAVPLHMSQGERVE